MSDLPGINPGPFCPVYHKTKDRTECGVRRCKYYVNHVVTEGEVSESPNSSIPDVTDSLDAISVSKPVVRFRVPQYVLGDECEWHCCMYDEPSKLRSVPWLE